VGETNWSLLNATGEVEWNMLHYGLETGNVWVPAEVNTSIRPEWFYHPAEDTRVKTLPHLMKIYYNSIGHNATLLLNFPIMPNGLINERDEKAALEFAKAMQETFAVNLADKAKAEASNVRGKAKEFSATNAIDDNKDTYWATDDDVLKASLTIDFGKPILFNRFLAQEYIRLGQRVRAFTLEAFVDGSWKEIAKATTIGYKRILRFPSVNASKVRINITDSKSCPVIFNIGVYNAPLILDAPFIVRNQTGEISISSDDIGPYFYYTLDGSDPSPQSAKFTSAVKTEGKIKVKAIAFDPASGKSSPVRTETFDICHKNWIVLGTTDENAKNVLDGNPETNWCQGNDQKQPIELVIDLGSEQNLCGFKYLPDQNRWPCTFITNYQFYVSGNNTDWYLVSEGEFSNIRNSPQMQVRNFALVMARFIKLKTIKNSLFISLLLINPNFKSK